MPFSGDSDFDAAHGNLSGSTTTCCSDDDGAETVYVDDSGDGGDDTVVVGCGPNTWPFTERDGFDLTGPFPGYDRRDRHGRLGPEPSRGLRVRLETYNNPITIDASKTALVIVDMQNCTLSEPLNKPHAGHRAERVLLELGIPAARRAGIQVVWLNWGLTERDLATLPPSVDRIWRFELNGKYLKNKGIGVDMGEVAVSADELGCGGPKPHLPSVPAVNGRVGNTATPRKKKNSAKPTAPTATETVPLQAGRFLMRGEWNTRLHAPLERAFHEGQMLARRRDVLFHKNRISGMCEDRQGRQPRHWKDEENGSGEDGGAKSSRICDEGVEEAASSSGAMEAFLRARGIRTLLFAGVNVDFCVMATLQTANIRGFDTVLLRDGCGTTNGERAAKVAYRSCRRGWGFLSSCDALAKSVEAAAEAAVEEAEAAEAEVVARMAASKRVDVAKPGGRLT